MKDPRINRFLVAMNNKEKEVIEKAIAEASISKNEFFVRAALKMAKKYK